MEITLNTPLSFSNLGQRKQQEDSRYPDTDVQDASCRVFLVCDGVGGMPHGDVASRVVAEAVGAQAETEADDGSFTREALSEALAEGYDALDRASADMGSPMATTIAMAVFHDGGVTLAHAGDSRIYQIRPHVGIVHQSQDHSLVNAMVHSGALTPEEAINHPRANVITRCLSSDPQQERKVDAFDIADIQEGDYFFLCTDGVTHMLPDSELLDILTLPVPDSEKIQLIKDKARGSSDNNTAILIPVAAVEHGAEDSPETKGQAASSVAVSGKAKRNFFQRLFGA